MEHWLIPCDVMCDGCIVAFGGYGLGSGGIVWDFTARLEDFAGETLLGLGEGVLSK